MKKMLFVLFGLVLFNAANAQDSTTKKLVYNPKNSTNEVQATCGTCMFKMEGKGCHLAYLVEGTSIDDHGDAHADDGFCNAIKKAKVQGTFEGDRFKSTYFEIVKVSNSKKQ